MPSIASSTSRVAAAAGGASSAPRGRRVGDRRRRRHATASSCRGRGSWAAGPPGWRSRLPRRRTDADPTGRQPPDGHPGGVAAPRVIGAPVEPRDRGRLGVGPALPPGPRPGRSRARPTRSRAGRTARPAAPPRPGRPGAAASSAPIACPPIRSMMAVVTRPPAAIAHGQASPADSLGRIAPTANAIASARLNEPSSCAACTPASRSWPRNSIGAAIANCASASAISRPRRASRNRVAVAGDGDGREHPGGEVVVEEGAAEPHPPGHRVRAALPVAAGRGSPPGASRARQRAATGPRRRSGSRWPRGSCRNPCSSSACGRRLGPASCRALLRPPYVSWRNAIPRAGL